MMILNHDRSSNRKSVWVENRAMSRGRVPSDQLAKVNTLRVGQVDAKPWKTTVFGPSINLDKIREFEATQTETNQNMILIDIRYIHDIDWYSIVKMIPFQETHALSPSHGCCDGGRLKAMACSLVMAHSKRNDKMSANVCKIHLISISFVDPRALLPDSTEWGNQQIEPCFIIFHLFQSQSIHKKVELARVGHVNIIELNPTTELLTMAGTRSILGLSHSYLM